MHLWWRQSYKEPAGILLSIHQRWRTIEGKVDMGGAAKLQGREYQELLNALLSAYDANSFARMLRIELDKSRQHGLGDTRFSQTLRSCSTHPRQPGFTDGGNHSSSNHSGGNHNGGNHNSGYSSFHIGARCLLRRHRPRGGSARRHGGDPRRKLHYGRQSAGATAAHSHRRRFLARSVRGDEPAIPAILAGNRRCIARGMEWRLPYSELLRSSS